jgi:hypothetical protein
MSMQSTVIDAEGKCFTHKMHCWCAMSSIYYDEAIGINEWRAKGERFAILQSWLPSNSSTVRRQRNRRSSIVARTLMLLLNLSTFPPCLRMSSVPSC